MSGVLFMNVKSSVRRYIVHDDEGPLRSFYTHADAKSFVIDGMWIETLPKPKKMKIDLTNEEVALW